MKNAGQAPGRHFSFLLSRIPTLPMTRNHRHSRWFIVCSCKILLSDAPPQVHIRADICLAGAGGPSTGFRRTGDSVLSDFLLGQLMPDILDYLYIILAHRVDRATTVPKLPIVTFEFRSPDCSYSIRCALLSNIQQMLIPSSQTASSAL